MPGDVPAERPRACASPAQTVAYTKALSEMFCCLPSFFFFKGELWSFEVSTAIGGGCRNAQKVVAQQRSAARFYAVAVAVGVRQKSVQRQEWYGAAARAVPRAPRAVVKAGAR